MNQLLIYKILYTNCNRIFVTVIILVSLWYGNDKQCKSVIRFSGWTKNRLKIKCTSCELI